MSRHVNIPIFIPHLGCPNQCVFCNQRTISGVREFDPESVRDIIDETLTTVGVEDECEIAFFGGSFTGIDSELMLRLLSIASEYVELGRVNSIRCSTRPDYINEEILDILSKHNVRTIELGLQSASDSVLRLTKRGHGFDAERRAAELIVKSGFDFVGQMMIGLPGSTLEDELETARFIISAGAVAVRIYPTVVFKETELCYMAEFGDYIPLSLEDAVERSAEVLQLFVEAGIKVIRIGLCASDNLMDPALYYKGPNHPALGELVESRLYLKKITASLSSLVQDEGACIKVFVPKGEISKAIGQKRINKQRLKEIFSLGDITFSEDEELLPFQTRVIQERKKDRCI